MAADRQPKMRRDDHGRSTTTRRRRAALDELLPLQQGDFDGLFEAMDGLPVTIRLLDPPLHEFLPDRYEIRDELKRAELESHLGPAGPRSTQVAGHARARGVQPDARHARRAARASSTRRSTRCRCARSPAPRARSASAPACSRDVEIMIPLVAYAQELAIVARAWSCASPPRRASAEGDYKIGTMIELPRACLVADADRPPRRVLLVRHERPHADRPGLLARRHRGRGSCRRTSRRRSSTSRRSSRSTRRASASSCAWRCEKGRSTRPGPAPRRLRRARRRPAVDRLLPPRRAGLRQLLAVPRPDRARRGRAGGDRRDAAAND